MELAVGRRPRDLIQNSWHPHQPNLLNEEIQKLNWLCRHISNPTKRRYSTGSCWRNKFWSSRSKSRRTSVLWARPYEQNSVRPKILKLVEGRDCCCEGCHGGDQYRCEHFSSKCKQTEKTFGHSGSARTCGFVWANRSPCVMAFLWWPNRRLGAIYWQFWAKEADSFSPQALQGSWSKMKIKNSKVVVMSLTVFTKYTKKKEDIWQQYRLCFGHRRASSPWRKHCFILRPQSRKYGWLKNVQYFQKKYHCKWTLLRGTQPKWVDFSQFWWSTCQRTIIFNNMGSFNQKSEFRKPENLNKTYCRVWKVQCLWIVTPQGIFEKQLCSCHHDGRGWPSSNRCKTIILGIRLGGMPLEQK